MEAVLDLYAEPPDPARPVVCFDECPYALRADLRPPIPARPGRVAREDTEYARGGACSLAMAFDRHRAWRQVFVAEQRRAVDFAAWLKTLVDEHYPDAAVIRLVVDNLNIHSPAALYTAFPAAEAHRLARKLEFHYTPTHGSWLNMVEIEWSALATQCLNRRLPTIAVLAAETAAWANQRNADQITVDGRFTTDRARAKLGGHYPQ
jgi:DDE superfamily endonuclease